MAAAHLFELTATKILSLPLSAEERKKKEENKLSSHPEFYARDKKRKHEQRRDSDRIGNSLSQAFNTSLSQRQATIF